MNNNKLFDEKLKRFIIIELDLNPYNYCEKCIINECESDETLCEGCKYDDNNNKIYEDILLRSFEVGRIELFKVFSSKIFVKNINEKLLSNYLRGEYRKNCCHSIFPHIFDENLNCIQCQLKIVAGDYF